MQKKQIQKTLVVGLAIVVIGTVFQNCDQFSTSSSGTSSSSSSGPGGAVPTGLIAQSAGCQADGAGNIDPTRDCNPAAVCDGSSDDTDTFMAAMAVLNDKGGSLKLPTRICVVNKTLDIQRSGIGIICSGGDLSCGLKMTVGGLPQIASTKKVSDDLSNISVKGVHIIRSYGIAVEGANGIDFSGWVNQSNIESVLVEGSFNNIVLGPTSISRARNIWLGNAIRDNLVLKTTSEVKGAALQWDIDSVGAGSAGRFGIFVNNAGASDDTSLGDWRNIQTYLNTSGSIAIVAEGKHSINDLRLDKGWLCCSTSGDNEIYINMNGGENNSITNTTVEVGNSDHSGRGNGIGIDGTTKQLSISNSRVNGGSGPGIYGGTTQQLSISNVSVINNGLGHTSSGVEITSGKVVATNLKSTGNTGYGFYLHSGTLVMSGGDLTYNSKYGLHIDSGAVAISGGDFTINTDGPLELGPAAPKPVICAVLGVSGYCN